MVSARMYERECSVKKLHSRIEEWTRTVRELRAWREMIVSVLSLTETGFLDHSGSPIIRLPGVTDILLRSSPRATPLLPQLCPALSAIGNVSVRPPSSSRYMRNLNAQTCFDNRRPKATAFDIAFHGFRGTGRRPANAIRRCIDNDM